jgi:hypothetical protein
VFNQRYRQVDLADNEQERGHFPSSAPPHSIEHVQQPSPPATSLGSFGTSVLLEGKGGSQVPHDDHVHHEVVTSPSTTPPDEGLEMLEVPTSKPSMSQLAELIERLNADEKDMVLKTLLKKKASELLSPLTKDAVAASVLSRHVICDILGREIEPDAFSRSEREASLPRLHELPPSPRSPPRVLSAPANPLKRKQSVADLDDPPARTAPHPHLPPALLTAVTPSGFPTELTQRTYVDITPRARFRKSFVEAWTSSNLPVPSRLIS